MSIPFTIFILFFFVLNSFGFENLPFNATRSTQPSAIVNNEEKSIPKSQKLKSDLITADTFGLGYSSRYNFYGFGGGGYPAYLFGHHHLYNGLLNPYYGGHTGGFFGHQHHQYHGFYGHNHHHGFHGHHHHHGFGGNQHYGFGGYPGLGTNYFK